MLIMLCSVALREGALVKGGQVSVTMTIEHVVKHNFIEMPYV